MLTTTSVGTLKSLNKHQLIKLVFKEAIRAFKISNIFAKTYFKEDWTFVIKPGFNTAAWKYDSKTKKHIIFIGEDCLSHIKKRGATVEEGIKHVIRLLRHERAHAKYTPRDLKKVQEKLGEVPFKVFNLIEDSFIESEERVEEGNFEWLALEDEIEAKCPWTLYFNYIQKDGSEEVKMSTDYSLKLDEIKKVRAYYEKSCMLKKADDRIKHSIEFFNEFKSNWNESLPIFSGLVIPGKGTGGIPTDSSGNSLEDLSLTLFLEGKGALSSFMEGAISEEDVEHSEDNEGSGASDKMVEAKDMPLEGYSVGSVDSILVRSVKTPDSKEMSKLANVFKLAFKVKRKQKLTEYTSKKLDTLALSLDQDKVFKREIDLGKGKKDVAVVVDLSGSMSGAPSNGAACLLAILNILTKSGYIKGNVIFAAGRYRTTFALPLPEKYVTLVGGHCGTEGIEPALVNNMSIIKKADHVFVYTDADIVDRPVVKENFNKYGIYTTALYIGDTSKTAEALRYFDKAISAKNISELIDRLVRLIIK